MRGRFSPIPIVAASALLALVFVALPAAAAAQNPPQARPTGPGPLPKDPESVKLAVFTFRHQRASEALATVRGMLSPRGSVALDEESNTLSVKDSGATLARIARAISSIDHRPQPLSIEVQLIRAVASQVSPAPPSFGVAADLIQRLKQVFRYDSYSLVARGRIETREGDDVDYELGDGYRLNFRPGTLYDPARLKLASFAVVRRQAGGADRDVVRTVVNLRREQPFILGLATDEAAARALLLAMRYEIPAEPAVPAATRAPGG